MKTFTQKNGHIKFFALLSLIFIAAQLPAQIKIQGHVVQENDGPVPFASVKLLNYNEGAVTDKDGHFVLQLAALRQKDSILITCVGYESIKISLPAASKEKKFILRTASKKMEAIVVRGFKKEDVAGAKSDNVGYYRSWNTNHSGGEIGRTVLVPYEEYLVSKVQFKIYSSCDTCTIRLRLREFVNGHPGDELLPDSVGKTFIKAYVPDKVYDFDLSKYNLVLTEENIFVSFEVLGGSLNGNSNCSFSFVGTEPGTYIYKTKEESPWTSTNDYSIHLKVFFRHN
jgi:hypothetical protein